MLSDAAEIGQYTKPLTEEQECRYLLQFLLESRGVCHENTLLLVLKMLEKERINGTESLSWSISQFQTRLNEVVNKINLKLNSLGYRVIRLSHGMGKACVSRRMQTFEPSGLPDSNRFYVYVNERSSDEVKWATRFNPREIEYVKWCLEQLILAGSNIRNGSISDPWGLVNEVDRIRCDVMGCELPSWHSYCSFTIGSTELSKYEEMNAMEIEKMNEKLCELKWFYRSDEGEYGMDLKAVAELGESLVDTFELTPCPVCSSLSLQGVMVLIDQGQSCWHVDCYQHYITHVSREYLGKSLITQGIYVI